MAKGRRVHKYQASRKKVLLRDHHVWSSHIYARRRCKAGALFCSTSFTFCNTNISCSLIPKEEYTLFHYLCFTGRVLATINLY